MTAKDYYQTLGVARSASAEEVRRAFRRLAREFHPDVAGGKAGAEDRFKEIYEAYAVLNDAAKRREYDATGQAFGGPPMDSSRPRSASAGPDADRASGRGWRSGFEGLFDHVFGRSVRMGKGFRTGWSWGKGRSPASAGRLDPEAEVSVSLEEAVRGAVRSVSWKRHDPCRACGGSGYGRLHRCVACGGSGSVTRLEPYRVKIPAGVTNGQRLRLAGLGRRLTPGEPPVDLFLRIKLAPHPKYRAVVSDLYADLPLAPWEAALGATVRISALTGEVPVAIPAGTQAGERLRLRGQGLPLPGRRRGDLFLSVQIRIPKDLTSAERVLWENLARKSVWHPRGA